MAFLLLLLALLQAPKPDLVKKVPGMEAQPPRATTATEGAPNILVVYLDDVGARDVELLLGADKLPNVDALAAQGTFFENGYGMPMCAPSRWSIMRSDWNAGNAGFACDPNTDGTGPGATASTLPSGVDSLPKAMEGAGYHTAYFGRWGLGTWTGDEGGNTDYAFTPMLWGFETFRAGLPDGVELCTTTTGTYTNWRRVDDGHVSMSSEYHTNAVVDEFVAWWPNAEGPRFAFVALQSAHKPFHWPPASAMPPGWTQPPLQFTRLKYEAMIQSADWALGEILEVIDLEDTLVVFLADNGTPEQVPPSGYNQNTVKFSTYEGGVRVPFIIAGLGFHTGGYVSDLPVHEVDLAPTFMDLAGICTPLSTFDGQSLVPALEGEPLDRAWVYVVGNVDDRAVIEERWKLRVRPNGNQFLYDLTNDPFELDALDPDTEGDPTVVARLRAALSGVE